MKIIEMYNIDILRVITHASEKLMVNVGHRNF